jgi:flavodoxin I
MVKTLIVYATLGGNTELAVKRCQEELAAKDFKVKIKRVDITSTAEIVDYDLVILASPTYGQGTVEQHFEPFLKNLVSKDYSGKKFAVIGLGDTKYYAEYLTESANVLEENILKAKGELVVPALRIGMPPLKFINKLIPGWVTKIQAKFENQDPNIIGKLVS